MSRGDCVMGCVTSLFVIVRECKLTYVSWVCDTDMCYVKCVGERDVVCVFCFSESVK